MIINLIRIQFGLFIMFNITAIYSRITLITAPLLIMLLGKLCNSSDNNIQHEQILRAFPWLGQYLINLENNPRLRIYTKHFKFALLCLLLLFYCLYICVSILLTYLLFDNHYYKDLSDNLFGIIAVSEFMSLIFVRTRTSLKYYPRFVILVLNIFLVNYQNTHFAFYYL